MQQTHGIILSTLNYRDYDLILTVFSSDRGLIKFFYKGGNSKKRKKGSTTDPLTCAEFIYSKGKGDLYPCHEISMINAHLEIRQELKFLEAGCKMIKAIAHTQFPEKPSPALYQMLLRYLGHIPKMNHPEILELSFLLKIMRHDGIFGVTPACAACKTPLKNHHICEKESFCPNHAPAGSVIFNEEESNLLLILAYCRTLSELPDIPLESHFQENIDRSLKNT